MNPSPYNDFILHNSQRRGNTLLITEEDYIDTTRRRPAGAAARASSRRGIDRDEAAACTPLDTWKTEMNGSPAALGLEGAA